MSATVHLQYAEINAKHSSHHKKHLNALHNSRLSQALSLSPSLSQCQCQSRLSSRLGRPYKTFRSDYNVTCFFFFLSVFPTYIVFPGRFGMMCSNFKHLPKSLPKCPQLPWWLCGHRDVLKGLTEYSAQKIQNVQSTVL